MDAPVMVTGGTGTVGSRVVAEPARTTVAGFARRERAHLLPEP